MHWKRLSVGLVLALIIVSTTPAWASMGLDSIVPERGDQVLGEDMHEKELENSQGTYLDVDLLKLGYLAADLKSAPFAKVSVYGNTTTSSMNRNPGQVIYYNQSTNTQNSLTNQVYVNGKLK